MKQSKQESFTNSNINIMNTWTQGFDCICTLPNGKTYVTKGDQYIRYSDPNGDVVDEGYPRPLGGGNWGDLPAGFEQGFDCMVVLPNQKTYVFKGDQYIRYSDPDGLIIDPDYPRQVTEDNWGKMPPQFFQKVDSGSRLPNGETYLSSGDQYIRYSDDYGLVVDAGYPKPLKGPGCWGDLPDNFAAGFDAMATLPNGKTYIFKGDQYVRYSDPQGVVIDPHYPKPIAGYWGVDDL